MNITHWPTKEQPREKLLAHGAAILSNAELLAIILRTGTKTQNCLSLAMQLMTLFGSLRHLQRASNKQLFELSGIGPVKVAQLRATFELARRMAAEQLDEPKALNSADDVAHFLSQHLRDEHNEVFVMLSLDSQHRLLHVRDMFRGSIDCAAVYPRVLVRQALDDNAAAVIIAHNHPSGIAEPSQADRHITKRIIDAMSLLDISVLDHFVIGAQSTVSFAQRGWL
ncbi:RadC family protein [Aestuariibacter salexigens]|uniref:RadC family protein n=1 Tax=Aestuariibacter salexigens TaxID=226010 RepID=UPI000407B3EE|nr:DNA repair protein RadC [Aestuariibacter salexigens]